MVNAMIATHESKACNQLLRLLKSSKKCQIIVVVETQWKVLHMEVPSCLSLHLKEIKILNFKGDMRMFEMISYFLDNAMVLEKLMIGMKSLSETQQSIVFNQLLQLPKSSKKCQVVIF
uniref:FBD domain-containing protein n=1 Tax=Gossypium raimondii TaxID=29730 RepID=A0A0D2N6G4_GOSRA|nr:hypothetical protein B456_005G010600 [Gossypium raimondii]